MKLLSYVSLILIVALTSCKTNLVYINAINPAPVTISNSTKNVGIISRTTPTEDNKVLNTIHQNVNGETLKLIKEASAESIKGLNDALIQNKRFEITTHIDKCKNTSNTARSKITGDAPSMISNSGNTSTFSLDQSCP